MSDIRPLAGIRVVDFSWAIVGNTATKLLGDFGAEVLKVESWSRRSMERARPIVTTDDPDSPDNKHWFAHIATSKKSITPELADPRGRQIIEDLVRTADVVVENFSPGTIERMGFGYEALRKLNPRIILASGSIFGQSGPMSHFPGVDATGAARAGRIAASGYPTEDRPLVPGLTYGDSVLPFFLAAGIMAGLNRRDETDEGCWIDASMLEVQVQQMWPLISAALAGDMASWRTGNRHPGAAPHNVYPANGEDRWIAIEVWTDDEWQAFCKAIDRADILDDARFATLVDRKANEDALDALVTKWTQTRNADEMMELLQAVGVAAGTVRSTDELVDVDPQLAHRGFLTDVEHPVLGTFGHQRTPITLQEGAQRMTHAPLMGAHNREVCTDILGMDGTAVDALEADGVFGSRG